MNYKYGYKLANTLYYKKYLDKIIQIVAGGGNIFKNFIIINKCLPNLLKMTTVFLAHIHAVRRH